MKETIFEKFRAHIKARRQYNQGKNNNFYLQFLVSDAEAEELEGLLDREVKIRKQVEANT